MTSRLHGLFASLCARQPASAPRHPAQRKAPPRRSSYLLEELQSRLLLSADLTGTVFSTTLGDPSVPTNAESAVVRVVNEGAAKVSKATQVAVYASADSTLGASDVLLGTALAPRSLVGGASANVSVPLAIPSSLVASAYQLLTRVDATNLVNERGGEDNNVSVGPAFDVVWQFGAVPGRTGSTTLSLVDPDGTLVRFSLTGPGVGEVVADGNAWDLRLDGTTAATQFNLVASGGNGSTVLDDVTVAAALGGVSAPAADLGGTLAVAGGLGTLTLGRVAGGLIAAAALDHLQVAGLVDGATVLVGTLLGADGQPGGSGPHADSHGAGRLGLVSIGGALTNSTVRVGQAPLDGVFDNGNDFTVGGASSSVGAITIGGSMPAGSRFVAGSFPATASIAGASVPTAGDPRFVANLAVLSLQARLRSDTGSSSIDGLTSDAAIAGTLTTPAPLLAFSARVDGGPLVDVRGDLGASGSFVLDLARLQQILGTALGDGPHLVQLQASDGAGNSASTSVAFTLDRQAPTLPLLGLAASSDTQTPGDQVTTAALVDLVVSTDPGTLLELVQTGATGTAGADGLFVFSAVPLALGANQFDLRAHDAAGNLGVGSLLLRRAAAPLLQPLAPIVAAEGTQVTFTAQASDADGHLLSFSVDGELPPGATFEPSNGTFFWSADETAGPGLYSFDVLVTDADSPALSDRQTVFIRIDEVNSPPMLSAPANLQAHVGQPLQFSAQASDTDLPANGLAFSLVGAPAGATIDASSGYFSWTPSLAQSGSFEFDIVVTDDGVPALADSVHLQVLVESQGSLSISDAQVAESDAGATTTAVFTVTLSVPSAQTVAVAYAVLPGSASDDVNSGEADFLGVPYELAGALVFEPGQTSRTVAVTIVGDNVYELDESFTLQLFAPTNTVLADAQGTGTIANDDPLPVIQAEGVIVGEGPGAQAQVLLTTDQLRDLPLAVNYATINGSAVAGSDYVAGSGTALFVGGQAWITIDLVDDALEEPLESFFVELSGPQGATLGTSSVEISIVDDDGPVLMAVADVQRIEGSGTPGSMQFTVSLSRASPGPVSVDYATVDGSATGVVWNGLPPLPTPAPGRDYLINAGTLTFDVGETSQVVTVLIGPDNVHEGNENFFLQLSNAQGNVVLDDGQAQGLIVDDDPLPAISVDDLLVYEPDFGSTEALFRVSLSNPSAQPVSAVFAFADGTAAAGSDYSGGGGSIVFAPGELEAWVVVNVLADGVAEADEGFDLLLSAVSGAVAGDLAGTATIADRPLLLADDVTVAEGNTPDTTLLSFDFTLSRPAAQDVSFQWSTSGSTATAGEDFVSAAGSAFIPAGELATSVTVQVSGDDLPELDEDFQLFVSGLQGARFDNNGLERVWVGRIANDDAVTYISIDDAQVDEGPDGTDSLATFSVTLSGTPPTDTVTVDWAVAPGSAAADPFGRSPESDFSAVFGTLVIEPGQTTAQIQVPVYGDDRYESDETFFVTLSAPQRALILDGQGRGLIVDDEPGPVLVIGNVALAEGNAGSQVLQFYVSLDTLPLDPASVGWSTADGSAVAGEDYTAASGVLDLADGFGIIGITVSGDQAAEGNETFELLFSDAQGVLLPDAAATITLVDDDGPSILSIDDVEVDEGSGGFEGYQSVVFTITRSGSTTALQTVDVATIDGSATGVTWDGSFPPPESTPGHDYLVVQDTITFAPGQTQAHVSVYIGPDEAYEGPEVFTLQLGNPTGGAALGDATGTAMIIDDDALPVLYVVGATLQEPADGATGEAEFTIYLSGTTAVPVTVHYATADGTATAGDDYAAIVDGSLTFQPGEALRTVLVPVYGDAVFEGRESFSLLLTAAQGGLVGSPSADAVVSDLPQLSAAPAAAIEGDIGGQATLDFVLTLTQPIPQDVTLLARTEISSASQNVDYVPLFDQPVTIPAGHTSVIVSVALLGDEDQEYDEAVGLVLYSVQNAHFPGHSDALFLLGLIEDDDDGPLLGIDDVELTEGADGESRFATFTVTLQAPPAEDTVHVDWYTQDGLAGDGSDYGGASGSLSFEAGTTSQSITIEVFGDGEFEPDEDFRVVLSNPGGALLTDDVGVALIVNDDDPVLPRVELFDTTVVEGDSGVTQLQLELFLSDTSFQPVSVDYIIGLQGDTAIAGEDYGAAGGLAGTIEFDPFQSRATILIDVLGDLLIEPDETFTVTLSGATNATLGTASAQVTVADDDTPLRLTVGDVTVFEGNQSLGQLLDQLALAGDLTTTFAQLIARFGLDPQNLDQELPPVLAQLGPFGIQFPVAVFEVSLDRPATHFVSVDFSTADGSAAGVAWNFDPLSPPAAGSHNDYIASNGRLGFDTGDQTLTVTVLLAPDTVLEADELFTLVLANPQGAEIADGAGTATVRADEGFSVSGNEVNEPDAGTTMLEFLITLPGPTTQTVSVGYMTVADDGTGSALEGSDYLPVSGTLVFQPGESWKTIAVPVAADGLGLEGLETLRLVLTNALGAPIVVGEAMGTIADFASLSVDDAQVIEGNEGQVELVFMVSLSAPVAPGRSVELVYGLAGQSAQPGSDFIEQQLDITLTEGQQRAEVRVQVLGDSHYEGNETLTLDVLAIMDGRGFAQALATGTIVDDEVALLLQPASLLEGDEGQTFAVFTLQLTAALDETLTVQYETSDGSAVAGEDYIEVGGIATFAPGETSVTVSVPVLGDGGFEADETFMLWVGNPADPLVAVPEFSTVGTIVNDDAGLMINDIALIEPSAGHRAAVFTVQLSGAAPDEAVTVKFATEDGTALAGFDYVAMNGRLNFAPGQTSLQFTIPVMGDDLVEQPETFRVRLSDPEGAQVLDLGGTATMENATPGLFVDDIEVSESDFFGAAFNVSLTGRPSDQPVTVLYTVLGETAAAGADFQPVSGMLVFAPGERTQAVVVPLVDDEDIELTETFRLVLSDPQGAEFGRAEALATLRDDELPVRVSLSSADRANESDGLARVSVRLDGAVGFEVRVAWKTSSGTAEAGADYVESAGVLVFQPGQTEAFVNVPVLDDALDEPLLESFSLSLFDAVNAELGDPTEIQIVIVDDEPTPVVSLQDVEVVEGNSGTVMMTFTVGLVTASASDITLGYSTEAVTASPDMDFLAAIGSIHFAAGETQQQVQITVLGDELDEGDESLRLDLTLLEGEATLPTASAYGRIMDDDTAEGGNATAPMSLAGTTETDSRRNASTELPVRDRVPLIDWTMPRATSAAPQTVQDWRRAFVDGSLLSAA